MFDWFASTVEISKISYLNIWNSSLDFSMSLSWLFFDSNNWRSNITQCFPCKFDFISVNISSFHLSVDTLNNISIFKMPFTNTFWLIIVKISFEKRSIWILPLSDSEISRFEIANEFHTCISEYISTFSVFVAKLPLTRVNVFININHNSFTMFLSILPVSIVMTQWMIILFAYTMFFVLFPLSSVNFRSFNLTSVVRLSGRCICVDTIFTMS